MKDINWNIVLPVGAGLLIAGAAIGFSTRPAWDKAKAKREAKKKLEAAKKTEKQT